MPPLVKQKNKFYEVICIINLKNTLFKGFTRGNPWVPPLMKQNLNRSKFMQCLQREDGIDGLVRTKHVCTYIRIYIHTYIHAYIHTYILTHMHTYIHTYIQTNIYIYSYI